MQDLVKYPYMLLPSYPHLSEAEGAIWERFIKAYPDAFDYCLYDICVGGFLGDEELNEATAKNRAYLGRYKIDVLGFKDGVATVIELKQKATTKALGEVWLYEHMWIKEHEPQLPVKTMIVTDKEMPNIREVAEKDGVALVIV